MATSKREQIVRAITARLGAVEGVDGRVFRSHADPSARDEHPFVTVQWVMEQSTPVTVPMLERRVYIDVSVYTRDDVPDMAADEVLVSVHEAIMADTTLGGLAIDMRLEDAHNEIVAADMPAAKVTHTYSVEFRHGYTDMTT